MKTEPVINFRQFRSNKSNKTFLVRFTIYLVLLSILAWILYARFSSKPAPKQQIKEIRGVKIEKI